MEKQYIYELDYNRVRVFGEYEIIYHLSGSIISLSPAYKPRKLFSIIQKFVEAFRKNREVIHSCHMYMTECSYKHLYKIVEAILFEIADYKELNLSSKEYKEKIDPDYIIPIDEWYSENSDFIDLDACVQNVIGGLYQAKEIFRD